MARPIVVACLLVSVSACIPSLLPPKDHKMTLVSNQENTRFEIRRVGEAQWTYVDKGKIVDTTVDRRGRYEVRATPDGYRAKTIPLASPFGELRFTFEVSDRLERPGAVVASRPGASLPTVGQPPGPPEGEGRCYAVCIGLSKFSDPQFPRLPYGAKDAEDVAALLRRQPRMSDETVKLLTDAGATKRKIDDALEGFLSKAGKSDMILLYWSGHGYPDPSEPDKVYFACYDTEATKPHTGFRMDKVRASLEEKDARHTIVLADTCHAGKIITRGVGRETTMADHVARLSASQRMPAGMAFLVGAAADRKAVEHSRWANGAFTHVLLDALSGKADGYQGAGAKDRVVTLGELRSYMQTCMPEETRRVLGKAIHPGIAVTTGDEAINRLPLAVVR